MPYPVAHVLFFVFCISAVAVYAVIRSIFHGELSLRDMPSLLLLLFTGSLCTLFPDIMAVYNVFVNGNLGHCWVGPVPTHSLLFSSSAIVFGTFVGYLAYRKIDKAIYLGLFAEAAFLTHLLLDDVSENGINYLYPIYGGAIKLSSWMDSGFQENGLVLYLLKSFVSVFAVFFVVMMALFALNKLGFEFKYKSDK
jgi:hypothetical protein